MQKLKVGVVGVATSAGARADLLVAGRVQFTGVYDIDPAVSRSIAQQYDIRAFASLTDLVDSVDRSRCDPTSTHFEVAKPFLSAGAACCWRNPCRFARPAKNWSA